jgi:hypothetical protein
MKEDDMSDPGNPDDEYNRDPGATVEEAGLPEVADDASPDGDVPEPQVPAVPIDTPSYGLFRIEEEETLDERLAEEEPDPTQDPELFADDEEEPEDDDLELDPLPSDTEPGL